ncbi:MAG: Rpn family recombination-promoting nuclease/putative transposase [Escherichia coli]
MRIYLCVDWNQSSPDENKAFRMLRHAIATMQRHLEAGHDYLPQIPILYQESVAHIHGQQTAQWFSGSDIARL